MTETSQLATETGMTEIVGGIKLDQSVKENACLNS